MANYYLYVAEEKGYSDFSKIGVTNCPWERLRKLQQGNPRQLRFAYLFCGSRMDIERLETLIKEEFFTKKEWFDINPSILRKLVFKKCKDWSQTRSEYSRDLIVREITDSRIVPYDSRTNKTCKISKNRLTIDKLFEDGNDVS